MLGRDLEHGLDADEVYMEKIIEEFPRLLESLQDVWTALQQLHRVLAEIATNERFCDAIYVVLNYLRKRIAELISAEESVLRRCRLGLFLRRF